MKYNISCDVRKKYDLHTQVSQDDFPSNANKISVIVEIICDISAIDVVLQVSHVCTELVYF